MIALQWERTQAIFLTAVEQPARDQAALVREQCGGDAELEQTILDMLEEDKRQHCLLDVSLTGLAKVALHSDRVDTLREQRMGPYRLLHLLGEGGSGVVYLADRADINVRVAIKLLRHAWLSPMRRERFAQEQQMLARLNHPGIARIYDASTLDDGTPWFAMEFVDGHPLTQWLELKRESVNRNLLLFRQICEAVRYAHSLAIVHRDLKPSNILVTEAGVAKLLDFGIAKQLDEKADAERTTDGLSMMTPAYAAPEQRNGGQVGVFTDVYALGVLLHEILTGKLPQVRQSVDGTGEPIALPPATEWTGRFCAEGAVGLTRHQIADLSLLCQKALELEPERRYRTVDALLDELNAYTEGRPLLARPRSRREVVFRFMRRHRVSLAAAAMVVVIFVVGFAIFTVRLEHARDAALKEAARVTRLQHFTESLFDGGDSLAGPMINLKTSDLLASGEKEAESLNDDPRMQADMYSTLGTVYQRLGNLPKADALLGRALGERKERFGEQDAQYVDTLLAVGLLRKDQRKLDEAESMLGEVVLRRRSKRDVAGLQQALVGLASVTSLKGQYDKSGTLLNEADALAVRAHTVDTAQYADTLTELADLAFYHGDYDRAETLYRRALLINQKLHGNNNPETAQLLNSLAGVERNKGNTAHAEQLLRQSLQIDLAWYGPDHPTVAANLVTLSDILAAEKHFDEAEALLQRALAIEVHAYGEQHSKVAEAWNEIGVLAYTRDRDDEAEVAFRKALAIYTAVYGADHQFVALCYSNLVGVDMDRKDYVSAERVARKAIQVYAVTLTEDSLNSSIAHMKLGRSLLRQQRYIEAEPESLRAYRYLATHPGQGSSYLMGARRDLSDIYVHLPETVGAGQWKRESQAQIP